MVADSVHQPDENKQNALLHVVRIAATRSARLAMYASALGAILLMPEATLPATLAGIAGGVGVNLLSNIIDRVAQGKQVSNEEIVAKLEDAIAESKIDELLSSNREVQNQITRLASWQRHLVHVIQSGNQELSDKVLQQYTLYEEIRDDVKSLIELIETGSVVQGKPQFPFHHLPYPRNPNFTGRQELLAKLEESLTPGQPVALTQAITGLGGIGKTQLALEYAYRHAADYDLIYWLRADDTATLAGDQVALAQRLGLAEMAEADQEAVIYRLQQWLGQTEHTWLLVFDNADAPNPADLQPYLPRTGRGHVLVTTRNPNWGGTAAVLSVELFSEGEAADFLLRRTGQGEDSRAEAAPLAEALGYLPLALEHAGAYIVATGATVADYRDLFTTRRRELWQRAEPPDAYHTTIATTWELAFEQVRQRNPVAVSLLDLCAFLAPGDIPLELIVRAQQVEAIPPELAEIVADPLALDRAIAALRRYSLMERIGEMLAVHRLVQAVVRDRMGIEQARMWVEAALELVASVWQFDEYTMDTRSVSSRLLPHLLSVLRHAEDSSIETALTAYLHNVAGFDLCWHFGREQVAKPHYERAVAIREKTLGPDHPDTAASLSALGVLLQIMGSLAEALPYLKRALAIRERTLGPDHPDTAFSLNDLGYLLQGIGRLTEARLYYGRALAVWEKAQGPDHPDTARSLNNLAALLNKMGYPSEARRYYERALAIQEKTLGPDHSETARTLNDLGALLNEMGYPSEARRYYERALAIWGKVLGPSHPGTAISLSDLGGLMKRVGNLTEARSYLERARSIHEQALGPDHPNTKCAKI